MGLPSGDDLRWSQADYTAIPAGTTGFPMLCCERGSARQKSDLTEACFVPTRSRNDSFFFVQHCHRRTPAVAVPNRMDEKEPEVSWKFPGFSRTLSHGRFLTGHFSSHHPINRCQEQLEADAYERAAEGATCCCAAWCKVCEGYKRFVALSFWSAAREHKPRAQFSSRECISNERASALA